jgi:hypothetical protein
VSYDTTDPHLQRILDHYTNLARNPATIDHARHRVKELEQSERYKGLGLEIKKLLSTRENT